MSTVQTYSEDSKFKGYMIVGTLARDTPRKRCMYMRYRGGARWAAMTFPQGCERVEVAKGTAGGAHPPSYTLQSAKRAALPPLWVRQGGHIKVASVQYPNSSISQPLSICAQRQTVDTQQSCPNRRMNAPMNGRTIRMLQH